MVLINRSFARRANYLVRQYTSHWTNETTVLFLQRMERLKEKISREDLFKLEMLAQERRFQSLTETLCKFTTTKSIKKV